MPAVSDIVSAANFGVLDAETTKSSTTSTIYEPYCPEMGGGGARTAGRTATQRCLLFQEAKDRRETRTCSQQPKRVPYTLSTRITTTPSLNQPSPRSIGTHGNPTPYLTHEHHQLILFLVRSVFVMLRLLLVLVYWYGTPGLCGLPPPNWTSEYSRSLQVAAAGAGSPYRNFPSAICRQTHPPKGKRGQDGGRRVGAGISASEKESYARSAYIWRADPTCGVTIPRSCLPETALSTQTAAHS